MKIYVINGGSASLCAFKGCVLSDKLIFTVLGNNFENGCQERS